MKTKYIIVDRTENTGKPYINCMDENCENEEDAKVYSSKKAAIKQALIFGEWATVKEISK
jgi:hypothetical protein